MSPFRMTAAALAAGVAAVWLLGQVPKRELAVQEMRSKAAVSAALRPGLLSDDNLADAIGSLRLRERLIRVGWDHSILSADLAIRDSSREPEALWSDLAEWVKFAFGDVRNVKQMLIRVFEDPDGRKTLLFYGDLRRRDWTEDGLSALRPPGSSGSEELFRSRLRLSATPAGARWLRNIAN